MSCAKLLFIYIFLFYFIGIIIFYELWMRGTLIMDNSESRTIPEHRIFHPAGRYDPLSTNNQLPGGSGSNLPGPATNFTVTGLEGFTEYEFQVICENELGKAASDWSIGRTATTGNLHRYNVQLDIYFAM
jgi:hypothetical protein